MKKLYLIILLVLIIVPFQSIASPISRVYSEYGSANLFCGDQAIIEGTSFGYEAGAVFIGGIRSSIVNWTNTRVTFIVPSSMRPTDYEIKMRTADSYDYFYFRGVKLSGNPIITSPSTEPLAPGDRVIINGSNFGDTFYSKTIYMNDEEITHANWSNNQISFNVPDYIDDEGDIKIRLSKGGSVYTDFVKYEYTLIKVADDELSAYQYYLDDINIKEAWNYTTGNKNVIVAVIDSGIYINHEDLRNNIWKNHQEIEGNNKDDDNNGYIDDIFGWNFLENNNDINVRNGNSHGTNVAGIIGATHGNNIGISGINKSVSLMSLMVCNNSGCDNDTISKAIRYAVDNGASIINLSLGSQGVVGYSDMFDEAIKYAFENNVLIVAAAGNGDIETSSGMNLNITKVSPVCNDGESNMVLGVGALNKNDYTTRPLWSNYGSCVDVWAPGVEIVTTGLSDYENPDGTSFSAPIVAGVAALIKAKYPSITVQELRDTIINSRGSGFIINALDAIDIRISGSADITYEDIDTREFLNRSKLIALEGTPGAAVYYVSSVGKKYIFSDSKTYFSWYRNFDNVEKVSLSELDSYKDGGTMYVRGGTKLITHQNTAKIYAVEPGGIIRWIPSSEIAESLFGKNWYLKVQDVLPGFFATSYTMGSSLSNRLPTGSIVKDNGSYYYIDDGAKRKFDDLSALGANGFNTEDVIIINNLSDYIDRSDIVAYDRSIANNM